MDKFKAIFLGAWTLYTGGFLVVLLVPIFLTNNYDGLLDIFMIITAVAAGLWALKIGKKNIKKAIALWFLVFVYLSLMM